MNCMKIVVWFQTPDIPTYHREEIFGVIGWNIRRGFHTVVYIS